MRDPLLQQQEYKKQLKQYQQKSGKLYKDLSELAHYFVFTDKQPSEFKPPKISRTTKRIPSDPRGIYNLYTLLGIFYLLEVISEQEIKEFLTKFDIRPPRGETDQSIFQKIKAGAEKGRSSIRTLTPEIQNKPMIPQRIRGGRALIIGLVFVLGGVVFARYMTLRDDDSRLSTICGEAIEETAPVFLPDQGFSQFLPSEAISGSSILSSNVRSIGINSEGVWVGYSPIVSSTDRISFYRNAHWIHYCTNRELLAGQSVNSFAFTQGKVYFATDGYAYPQCQDHEKAKLSSITRLVESVDFGRSPVG